MVDELLDELEPKLYDEKIFQQIFCVQCNNIYLLMMKGLQVQHPAGIDSETMLPYSLRLATQNARVSVH